MMRLLAVRSVFIVLLFSGALASAENFDLYPFDSPEQEARFDRLTQELRCPKCQNQSLADSNAPIAQDLRKRTYELVREGRTDEEIVAYLKERYGEFIAYRPAFNAVTALLWSGPFVLLLGAGGVLFFRLRGRASAMATADAMAREESRADADKVRDIMKRFEQEPRR